MNVGELIEHLSQYPKELKVLIWRDAVMPGSPYIFGEYPTSNICIKKSKMFDDDDEALSFVLISVTHESI